MKGNIYLHEKNIYLRENNSVITMEWVSISRQYLCK